MFFKELSANIKEKYKSDTIPWEKVLSPAAFKKLPAENVTIFANVSISDKTIKVPSILDSFVLKKDMFNILEKSHEGVKNRLAEIRKQGQEA